MPVVPHIEDVMFTSSKVFHDINSDGNCRIFRHVWQILIAINNWHTLVLSFHLLQIAISWFVIALLLRKNRLSYPQFLQISILFYDFHDLVL